MNLSGKIVVLTGGRGFLGSQLHAALSDVGAKVHILDLTAEPSTDITDPVSVEDAIRRIVKEEGRIDGLIHAAALNATPGMSAEHFAPYEEFSLDLWEREFNVNLTAAQIVTQAVAKVMMSSGSGSIIFIASDLALIAPQNAIYDEGKFKDIAYVSSKAGMLGLMRAWASYLGQHGIRVNALVPGGIFNGHSDEFAKKNGALNMLGRMARPGEYDAAIAFLLSDGSSFMTGSSLVIDGGRTAW